ncbi:MAG: cysteine--tRNA ligase [Microgenomates group bacterium]
MKKSPLTLYNTLSRSIEPFEPLKDTNVGLYACGVTVYDFVHLGHLRKYAMDDVLVRVLRNAGHAVNFVQNVTDVGHLASDADTGEDKLEKGAKKYGKTVWDIAAEFEQYFWKSMDAMGNLRPDVSCRATDHIKQQLEMVLELEKKGFTYVIPDDGVYFDTSKISDYGKLAHLKLEELREGARLEANMGKRNPTDFALWKFERPGENRAMVWESPWSERSFPGWHIECSAMAVAYLGEQFDIHTGGIDHIPVHHTNEIAQAESATGKKPFVKYWVHHNFLRVEGEKMSKSLGNFYTIDDVIEKGFNPQALRLLFMTSHYRSELNFTWDSLAGMQKRYDAVIQKIQKVLENVPADFDAESAEPQSNAVKKYTEEFLKHLNHDLGTPEAITVFWKVLKDADMSAEDVLHFVVLVENVLGLSFISVAKVVADSNRDIPAEVRELLEERIIARKKSDWSASDRLRDELFVMGFIVEDLAEGAQSVKKR